MLRAVKHQGRFTFAEQRDDELVWFIPGCRIALEESDFEWMGPVIRSDAMGALYARVEDYFMADRERRPRRRPEQARRRDGLQRRDDQVAHFGDGSGL